MTHISSAYRALWADPEIQSRIETDIDRVRKSNAHIHVQTSDGHPVPGALVACEQTSSAFHFGANIFMLDGYSDSELNARYEAAYTGLFNAATVPFYWKGLEPQRGLRRFAADNAQVARRPSPDRVIAFCEQHGLRMHGHPLVWDFSQWSVPEWLDAEPMEEQERIWEQHVTEIAQRYGNRIRRWDVVNEVMETARRRRGRPGSVPLPENYDLLAFKWAQAALPADARLYINEATAVWNPTNLALWIQCIRRLFATGARVEGAGLQFHMFFDEKMGELLRGECHTPQDMFRVLDQLAPLGLPLHISEITLTSLRDDDAGREAQAEAARNFYRLWFSHPSVDGITWWNLPDGGAAAGEDKVTSGLLDTTLAPKQAYSVLHDLLHHEWRTSAQGHTGEDGSYSFRGFQGDYQITVSTEGQPTLFTLELTPGPQADLVLTIEPKT